MNLLDLLAVGRSRGAGRPALRWRGAGEVDVTWSHGELEEASARWAAALARRGLAAGDRIALLLGNRPELALALLAAWRLGAIVVPINTAYRRREIAHILGDARPRLVLTEAELRPALAELGEEELAEALPVDVDELAAAARPSDPAASATGPAALVDGSAVALILYTSGTTGRSKGAMLTHDNLLATVTGLLAAWGWRESDTLLLLLPLFHTHGLVVGLLTALAAGARVELHRRFAAALAAERLASGEVTLFFGVPTMYTRLVESLAGASDPSRFTGVRLCCSGSAPLAPETFAAFRAATGHAILERYGMTETGMLVSNLYAGERRPGTVGSPLPGVSVRIVDGAEQEVVPGGEGELWVRGANVFAGYWGLPEKTAESFRVDERGARWFATGDLARQDPATGAITLLGRRHDLIISGGFNIYPRELEEVLETYPGVREAAVVGQPHPEWGEVPLAFLVSDEALDEVALLAHCRSQLAAFKSPRAFRRLASLPRNALGKVQKHLLPRD